MVEHACTSTHPCPGREAYVHVGSLEISGENTGPDDNQPRADCFFGRMLAGAASMLSRRTELCVCWLLTVCWGQRGIARRT